MVPLLPTQPSFRAQADQLPRGLEIIHRTPPAAWNILATGRGVLLGTACRGGMDAVQPLWASLQSTGPHLCGLKHKRSKNINLTQGLSQHHVAFVSFPGTKVTSISCTLLHHAVCTETAGREWGGGTLLGSGGALPGSAQAHILPERHSGPPAWLH